MNMDESIIAQCSKQKTTIHQLDSFNLRTSVSCLRLRFDVTFVPARCLSCMMATSSFSCYDRYLALLRDFTKEGFKTLHDHVNSAISRDFNAYQKPYM